MFESSYSDHGLNVSKVQTDQHFSRSAHRSAITIEYFLRFALAHPRPPTIRMKRKQLILEQSYFGEQPVAFTDRIESLRRNISRAPVLCCSAAAIYKKTLNFICYRSTRVIAITKCALFHTLSTRSINIFSVKHTCTVHSAPCTLFSRDSQSVFRGANYLISFGKPFHRFF